ncbi:MAG: hypothetical protein II928_03050 [Paludibacteraceae bacterium]|nr:hypothetical protein [Paludibacteraceae bacterium]
MQQRSIIILFFLCLSWTVQAQAVSSAETSSVVVNDSVVSAQTKKANDPLTPRAIYRNTDSKDKNNRFTMDLNLMARGEIRDGGYPAAPEAEKPTDFGAGVVGRARLTLEYERKWLLTRISLQYAGAWGQEGINSFNLYEAFARLHSKHGLFMQFGRQVLNYDDERIIGADDWTMTAHFHDALILGYSGFGHQLHLIGAYNQNSNNLSTGTTFFTGGAQPYKTMQTLWYHYQLPSYPFGASFLFMNIGMQAGEKGVDEHLEWQQLAGAYFKISNHETHPIGWSLEGSYYHQFGREEHGGKIDAFMASAKATISPMPIFGFQLGYDYLSGDPYFAVPSKGQIGLIRHDVIRGFNPVYGSHHQFYGAMDFFYLRTFVNGFTPGLQNAYAGVDVHPIRGMDLSLKYHYMATAVKLEDIEPTLGHEVEIDAAYQIIPEVKLSLGFSYMAGTKSMEKLRRASGDGRMYWGWLSIVATPRFLDIKW